MARIILLNRYFFPDESATAQLLSDLARSLSRQYEVIALCSRQLLEQPQTRLGARERVDRLEIRRLWSTRFGRRHLLGRALDYASFLASAWLWLVVMLRRGDTLIAKTDPPLLGVVAALAAIGRGVTLAHWLQDLYPETAWRLGVTREGSPAGRLLRMARDWSLRRARLVVAVSQGMGDYLQAAAGIPPPRVIHNWADDMLASRPSPYRAADEAGSLVVGYSGNLGRAHPIGPLLALAQRMRDGARCRFLFSGGGAHFESLRDEVGRMGIGNWRFLPYQPRDRLPDLLTAADLHLVLLDPRVEPFVFPSKLYGILSAGRPVLHLGNPNGELGHLVKNLDCGWSFAEDALDEITALLDGLSRESSELRRRGDNARRAYQEGFSKGAALSRWEAALAALHAPGGT